MRRLTACAPADRRYQAGDDSHRPLREEDYDDDEDRAEDHLLVLGVDVDLGREDTDEDGSYDRAERRLHPAAHD